MRSGKPRPVAAVVLFASGRWTTERASLVFNLNGCVRPVGSPSTSWAEIVNDLPARVLSFVEAFEDEGPRSQLRAIRATHDTGLVPEHDRWNIALAISRGVTLVLQTDIGDANG